MGTHATVGILLPNGKVKGVYVHFDGYPDSAGAVLREHYQTTRRTNSLINGGDMRSVDEHLKECGHYKDGERSEVKEYDSIKEWCRAMRESYCEYAYLYQPSVVPDNNWTRYEISTASRIVGEHYGNS